VNIVTLVDFVVNRDARRAHWITIRPFSAPLVG
jgi:hypothetical protein